MPVQDAGKDSGVLRDRSEPSPPDYIRGPPEVHKDVHPIDAEFSLTTPLPVEDINLSSGDENNFRVHVRAIERLSSAVPPLLPVSTRNRAIRHYHPPLSPTALYERERERTRVQFIEEVEFEV
jgi:hypothetical protein